MKITITIEDRQHFRNAALYSAGYYQNLFVKPVELTEEVLFPIVKNGDKEIYNMIIKYFEAYDRWFNFIMGFKEKQDVLLTNQEEIELHDLRENRNLTLNNLLNFVKTYQKKI